MYETDRSAKRHKVGSGAGGGTNPACRAPERLRKLPSAVACLVFAHLSLRDNRRLACCAPFLQDVGCLLPASPLDIELRDVDGRLDMDTALMRIANTMRPHSLTLVRNFVPPCMDALTRIATLRRLELSGTELAELHRLSALTALTDLTVRGTRVSGALESAVATCTTLVRLNLCLRMHVADLAPLAALTRLESLTLERVAFSGADMWAPLRRLPRLAELGLVRNWHDPRQTEPWPDLPADVGARLTRITARGNLLFEGTLAHVSKFAGLRSLDITGCDPGDSDFCAGMTQLEQLALTFAWQRQPPSRGQFYLTNLRHLGRLHTLVLRNSTPTHLDGFAWLTALTELDLARWPNLNTLAGIVGSVPLRALSVSDCPALIDVRALAHATRLTRLSILDCRDLQKLRAVVASSAVLSAMPSIEKLKLDHPYKTPLLSARLLRLAFGSADVQMVQMLPPH